MSFTKETIKQYLFVPIDDIRKKTVDSNDCSVLLVYLNSFFEIRDAFVNKNEKIGALWNEICIDLLSVINAGLSGFYRNGIIGLRSVLELGCNSFYYLDHQVEYYLFENSNKKADKYVSALIKEFDFFRTNYVKAFKANIDVIQTEEDSISNYLKKLYATLSDVVHGRYNKLAKIDDFHITYDINQYKQFEGLYIKTVNILCIMAMLRLDAEIDNMDKMIENTGVIKYV